MNIMIAGAWDEKNHILLNNARLLAKNLSLMGNIIITGGGTGVPTYVNLGVQDAKGISIEFNNSNKIFTSQKNYSFTIFTEMGWDGRRLLAVKSSDLLIVLGGNNGTLNEITLAYLNKIPIFILRNSSDLITRFEKFLYKGKYIDIRENQEILFFDNIFKIINKIKGLL